MARGLPCVASNVGGIPELLAPEDLVPPEDVEALAAKIREVLSSRERMAQMAARNLKRARDFHRDMLWPRRRAFYAAVRHITEEWQRRRTGRDGT
jgi:glycosyltransferase involved in cell wall biosynthesis